MRHSDSQRVRFAICVATQGFRRITAMRMLRATQSAQHLRAEPFQNAAARKTLVSMMTVICAD